MIIPILFKCTLILWMSVVFLDLRYSRILISLTLLSLTICWFESNGNINAVCETQLWWFPRIVLVHRISIFILFSMGCCDGHFSSNYPIDGIPESYFNFKTALKLCSAWSEYLGMVTSYKQASGINPVRCPREAQWEYGNKQDLAPDKSILVSSSLLAKPGWLTLTHLTHHSLLKTSEIVSIESLYLTIK